MDEYKGDEIAVIGLSCRMPGAKDVDAFWKNIQEGTNSITYFTDRELLDAGVPPDLLKNENFVGANAKLDDVDKFDAAFFEINKKEAEILDPQHRLFLEESYKALDDAGYSNPKYNGRVSIFGGCDMNTYLLNNLMGNQEELKPVGDHLLMMSNDKDFLTTRVSYLLKLNGPSVNIQSACSTSLVAIHMACQSLLNGESDMALAGGVSVRPPMTQGYMYMREMIQSADGYCRPFDSRASGTVFGNGVGIVVLKTLADALRDHDNIIAVVRSSAVNNDGSHKVGYTAPSVKGQSDVIVEALNLAGIDVNTIGYVETHGTGTLMGDPIEIQALDRSFKKFTQRKGFCAIGSVKANIGHASAAAGVAGFIKAALILRDGIIPPLVNYKNPNPNIQFADTAFYIPVKKAGWKETDREKSVRRAAVSSFGIGGTNAHVILENAPPVPARQPEPGYSLVSLSAKSAGSLKKITRNLGIFLQTAAPVAVEDIAYTCHLGREAYNYRNSFVCRTQEELINLLLAEDPANNIPAKVENKKIPVFFLFPGQGSLHQKTLSQLYEENELFRFYFDQCALQLLQFIDTDIRHLVHEAQGNGITPRMADQTEWAQPLIFSIDYALASVLKDYGIVPEAMIGHSLGEYVAATMAGVFTLSDALKIVAHRGKLMQRCEPGAMVSVMLPEDRIAGMIGAGLAVAAINTAASCVVSGPFEAVENLEAELEKLQIPCQRLNTSHAFHSPMMAPCTGEFRKVFHGIKLSPPSVSIISTVDGNVLRAEEAMSAAYWVSQILRPVNYNKAIRSLLKYPEAVFVEVGPGSALTGLTRENALKQQAHVLVNLLPHQNEKQAASARFLEAIGKLWSKGVSINFEKMYARRHCRRCRLPSYPFENKTYWIDKKAATPFAGHDHAYTETDVSRMFYTQCWSQSLTHSSLKNKAGNRDPLLVFKFGKTINDDVASQLQHARPDAVFVGTGKKFADNGSNEFTVNPLEADDYRRMFHAVNLQAATNVDIVFDCDYDTPAALKWNDPQQSGFLEILALAKYLGNHTAVRFSLFIITNGLHSITGTENIRPEQGLVQGAAKIIPLEYQHISARIIDLYTIDKSDENRTGNHILGEMEMEEHSMAVAYRGKQRFLPTMQKIVAEHRSRPSKILPGGVYVITGGLRGVGLEIALSIASGAAGTKLALLSRSKIADRSLWEDIFQDARHENHETVKKLLVLEKLTAALKIFSTDISDHADTKKALKEVTADWGKINGVVHAAGVPDYNGVIENRTKENLLEIQLPKVHGTLVLDDLIDYNNLDFFILFSSISSFFYKSKIGQVGYVAANEFVDAFCRYHRSIGKNKTTVLSWNDWKEIGMSVKANERLARVLGVSADHAVFEDSVTPQEGRMVFMESLFLDLPQLIVSKKDLCYEQANYHLFNFAEFIQNNKRTSTLRDRDEEESLRYVEYIEPGTVLQKEIIQVWTACLGVKKIGINDNFFDLGGHSLIAIQAVNLLQKNALVQCSLSLEVFFQHPTVTELSEYIENVQWQHQENEVELQDEEGII